MPFLIKGIVKKYGTLIVLFLCTLLIPSLLYSFSRDGYRPYRYPPLVKYSFKWPEEEQQVNDRHHFTKLELMKRENLLKEIDRRFCGRDKCRFVLPIIITEQESKAQLHFRQIAFLAGKVDRIIVLPNVHNSHLGACLAHPFDYYYDHSWLDRKTRHFKYITMENFQAWLKARQEAQLIPVGQEIIIKGYNHHQHHKTSDLLMHKKNCFHDSFDFSSRPAVTYQMRDTADASNFEEMTQTMISLLSDEARQHEYIGPLGMLESEDSFEDASDSVKRKLDIPPVDVIHLFYDRRFRFLDQQEAQAPLSYNKRWIDIAEEISSQLQPFLAIHWRMEQLEPSRNLLPCAKGLVKKIHRLKEFKNEKDEKNTKHPNVFLLTDYPHLLNTTGAKPESNSFKLTDLNQDHHDAIHYLYSHLNITLTDLKSSKIHPEELPKENWHLFTVKNHRVSPIDRSVLGIIDKLVAMRAQWFFAGKPRVCAKSSSFTGRIQKNREEAFEKGDKNIILPMDLFDIQH